MAIVVERATNPALERVQAKRRLLRFRQLGLSVVLMVVTIGYAAFTDSDGFKPSYEVPIFLVAAGTLAMMFVQVVLDLGTGPMSWVESYRHALAVVDQYAARQEQVLAEEPESGEDLDKFDREQTALWQPANFAYVTRSTIDRISAEIDAQGSRATVNLSIALAVASVGLAILGWLAFDAAGFATSSLRPAASTTLLMLAFASKVALALTANVFAFFFLSTYRRNLNEIRYFHNELTNIQSRVLALYVAKDHGATDAMSEALRSLTITERNLVLKPGETTTDLSLKSIDREEVRDLSQAVLKLTDLIRAGK